MDTRRSFLKKTAMLSGAAGIAQFLPASIQRALAIQAEPGSTFLDAEHIVLLMQENRSFDHAFGTLRGVRGFNDPRAIDLPNRNKVWLQTNKAGETYAPFRLDIKDTKITWMGSLPHGRQSQMDARNGGSHDNWLEAKKSDGEGYEHMPLTMGYYTRDDIPFYYALADAFTVCDQNFCSSLTGTDPNRLYFWSGTVKEKELADSRPYVQNDDVERGVEWETFPELLEKNGISWKVYQNEISAEHGFTSEQDVWLGNFGDNVLEYFNHYHVKFSNAFIDFLPKKIKELETDIMRLKDSLATMPATGIETEKAKKSIAEKQASLEEAVSDQRKWTRAKFKDLSDYHKRIHSKAFVTNKKDPDQYRLEPLEYDDGNTKRQINIPKGDILHQFREDVKSGSLPTVSWLVAPECFSDHPSAPWFGSWYLSETMDILTQNPEVWKKTIFILAYDENDGYFDHVPPFVAPDPKDPSTGKVSKGIDTALEQVKLEQDAPGPIGLGYRVPLVIASPWSRGGWVNSQVFDHTSTLQFLEQFVNKKFGKNIKSEKISNWRRTVCGDFSSVFRVALKDEKESLPFIRKEPFIESVHKAKFKNAPNNYKNLTKEEIAFVNNKGQSAAFMPRQENGIKPSCALPYDLNAEGNFGSKNGIFDLNLTVSNSVFREKTAGAAFTVYTYGKQLQVRNYALVPGDHLSDQLSLDALADDLYDVRVHGPNGFFRSFTGNKWDPPLLVSLKYEGPNSNLPVAPANTGRLIVGIINPDPKNRFKVRIVDNAYKNHETVVLDIPTVNEEPRMRQFIIDTRNTGGWYDLSVLIEGSDVFERRFAGRVETGKHSITDPFMGGEI